MIKMRPCFWALVLGPWVLGLMGLPSLLRTAVGAEWETTKPVEGIREPSPNVHALVHARIIPRPGELIRDGTVVLRDGRITDVGADIEPPPDARLWPCDGLTIYPGLIEPYCEVGAKEPPTLSKDLRHWSSAVRPDYQVLNRFEPSDKALKSLRKLGFAVAQIVPKKGLFRGKSGVVTLGNDDSARTILAQELAQTLSIGSVDVPEDYPTSLMGRIALVRQTFLDAAWYAKATRIRRRYPDKTDSVESNRMLRELAQSQDRMRPFLAISRQANDFARLFKLGKEFEIPLWIRGNGTEYRKIPLLKEADVPILLPLDFPEKPAVSAVEEALDAGLRELMHWELAPENPKRLNSAGIRFALTSHGLKKRADFFEHLREAIDRGLPRKAALAALTTVPSELMGLEDRIGSICQGKQANLVVSDGPLFAKESDIRDVWIAGKRYEITSEPEVDPRGKWKVKAHEEGKDGRKLSLRFKGEPSKLSGKLHIKDKKEAIKLRNLRIIGRRLRFSFDSDALGHPGVARATASVENGDMMGTVTFPDGQTASWQAVKREQPKSSEKEADKNQSEPDESKNRTEAGQKPEPIAEVNFPFGAYGRDGPPKQPRAILIENATLWTCGPPGTLKNADLLIEEGVIEKVGCELDAPGNAKVIEGAGKHVTPGIVDAHSHTAVDGGFNEMGQAVTAEVRIKDALNPQHIEVYRQLSGGLTTALVLHGSANPIGGQSQVIKHRWGGDAERLIFEEAASTIKFALGENVTRKNWSDPPERYPRSRMGVEELIRDRLRAAREYQAAWERYRNAVSPQEKIPPRRDLELEALVEVLKGKRKVHCHSYRQDEILMLIRVAEDFGFRIGTFQHVLEGYKVADEIAEHGAGGSTFADFWAYKWEVFDAIPYNAALMHKVGVLTSINSDSARDRYEWAKRLNTEAAKAVKYGGVSEEEALKMVTLYPAIQLGVGDQVGSLEQGKDADFVVWNGHPLSSYTECEETWIDGRKYYDRQADQAARKNIQELRNRLVQKVLQSDQSGDKGAEEEKDEEKKDSLP